MQVIKTGVKSVDDLYGIAFTGNLVPPSWCYSIVGENGKPNMIAVMILAEIVYWYRPKVEEDPADGSVKLKKKIKADLLQLSYSSFEEKFNISRDQYKRAFALLKDLGIVRIHFRNVRMEDNRKLNNVMYIELFAERLLEITSEISHPVWKNPQRGTDETTEVISLAGTDAVAEPQTNTKITAEITDIDHTSFFQKERAKVKDAEPMTSGGCGMLRSIMR